MVRRCAARTQRRTGRPFTKPRKLFPKANQSGRYDLHVNLEGRDGRTRLVVYAHLVACSLLQTEHDPDGRNVPWHYIKPAMHDRYEADHYPVPDQCDCRLANLRLQAKSRHRSEGRLGWSRTTLPPARRGLKRPASALQKKLIGVRFH